MYFNTTVANFSPLLLYVPQALWSEALPQDPLLSDYATQSYHATSASQGQASVSFSWSGTGVWLYGGYRPTLGAYKVVVDGKVCQYPGFQNGSTSQANYLLHGSRNLTAGTHSIELTNISEDDEQNILDLDYLVFETYTNEDLVPRTVHYSESDIQYISTSPDEDWNSQPDFRVTNAATGVIKLNFTGISVAVYGPINPAQASYLVSVDGGSPSALIPNTLQQNVSSGLIYFNGALEQGEHSLVITNNPLASSNRTMIGLSYVEINSTTRETNLPPQTISERNDAIIGAILICSSVIAVILLTRWWLRRTSRRKAHHRELYAARPFMGLSISRRHTASSLPISRPASPQSTDQVVLYHSGASRHTGAQGLPNLIESTAPASPPLASVPNPPTKTSRQRVANRSRPQLPLEPRVPARPSRLAPNLQQRNGVIDRGPQAPIIELPPPYNTHMFMRL